MSKENEDLQRELERIAREEKQYQDLIERERVQQLERARQDDERRKAQEEQRKAQEQMMKSFGS